MGIMALSARHSTHVFELSSKLFVLSNLLLLLAGFGKSQKIYLKAMIILFDPRFYFPLRS